MPGELCSSDHVRRPHVTGPACWEGREAGHPRHHGGELPARLQLPHWGTPCKELLLILPELFYTVVLIVRQGTLIINCTQFDVCAHFNEQTTISRELHVF